MSIASQRADRFAEQAELISSRVLRAVDGVVWVGYEREGWQEVELVPHWPEDFVKGDTVPVLVDRSDPTTAHLPGDEVDYLETPVGPWLLISGDTVGAVLLAVAVPVGWHARRLRRLLSAYPWRALDFRWDPRSSSFVGLAHGAWVRYPMSNPRSAVLQVAGPQTTTDLHPRSVVRLLPDNTLHVVRGPCPATPLEPPSLSWHSELFEQTSFLLQATNSRWWRDERQQVLSPDGRPVASMQRSEELVQIFDLSDNVILALRGSRKHVQVIDSRGAHRGRIAYGRDVDVFPSGSPTRVAHIARVDGHRSTIFGETDAVVLGEITYRPADAIARGHHHTTIALTAHHLPTPLRALAIVASLTSRWAPHPPSE